MDTSTVGAFEAKTHFSKLLERVARGEQITITRHGNPVARLMPVEARDTQAIAEAIRQLKELRKGHRLDGLSIREMINEGRP